LENSSARTIFNAMKPAEDSPIFFAKPAAFRTWLERHHQTKREQWVGFHRKASGRPSITWPEAVDEALCFGWIDGLRKTIDAESYKIRFTPRRPTSNWSAVNIRRMKELMREPRVRPAGIKAFRKRAPGKSGIYSYENRKSATLSAAAKKKVSRRKRGLAIFSTPTSILSADRDLVGGKREAPANSRRSTAQINCFVQSRSKAINPSLQRLQVSL
jgi:uncharacterized protein YdeI (YjbR/CyaY-like superfamily)